jgi:hypothetical protein
MDPKPDNVQDPIPFKGAGGKMQKWKILLMHIQEPGKVILLTKFSLNMKPKLLNASRLA